MEIKLDTDAAASIASAAILQSLSEENKQAMIQQALQYLMTPERDRGYGLSKSPMQNAFDSALHQAAHKVVQDHIASLPEVETAITDLLGPLLNGVVKKQSENWNDELAGVIGNAIGDWLADKARRD